MIVRIENLDFDRCKAEYEESILEDLDWLGVPYQKPVLRQSDRMDAYRCALDRYRHFPQNRTIPPAYVNMRTRCRSMTLIPSPLYGIHICAANCRRRQPQLLIITAHHGGRDRLQSLGVLYQCFCSRKDVASMLNAPHGPDGILYSGKCRHLSVEEAEAKIAENRTYALRINIEKAFEITGDLTFDERGAPPEGMEGGSGIPVTSESVSRLVGDAVLARKDGSPAYHLSVVVDDAFQNVTRVTRGSDLYHATHLHRLLQALLDLPSPRYDHHGIVVDDTTGMRLAKRDKSTTLRDLRAAGSTPEDVIRRVGM